MVIEYIFRIDGDDKFQFTIDTDRTSTMLKPGEEPKAWTELSFHQCPNCPLSPEQHKHCPAALDMQDITEQFSAVISYQGIEVIVKTPLREYRRITDAQNGVLAINGLVMATSGCPILSRFGAMADFHLPFASLEESIFRSASSYLISQYYVYKDGGTPDFEFKGLEAFYNEVNKVNAALKNRVFEASSADASINAFVQLFGSSALLTMMLHEQLEEMREKFAKLAPRAENQ
jgi:hypothetical protein